MPRQEHVLSVFVASPVDVNDERDRLEEVVRDLNETWSRNLGLRLELLKWETHAYPGVGIDAQAVINEQVPNDYDVFVGIMWHRFGSPTTRADSGTLEEFERAKRRHDADSESVSIMFYFKDTPIPPSKLEPDQLARVIGFRKSLGEEGVLYWTFSGLDEFEKLLRLHITRLVQAWHGKLGSLSGEASTHKADDQAVIPSATVEEDEELGLLDLAEIFTERFAELTPIIERMTSSTEELGLRMDTRTKEINTLRMASQEHISPSIAKRLIARAAGDMDQYVSAMEKELPAFSKNLNEGMDALIQVTRMLADSEISDDGRDEARKGLEAIGTLRAILLQSEQQMGMFREVVAGLPRMTSVLNKSKRSVVSVLDRLMEEFRGGQNLVREAERLLKALLENALDQQSAPR